MSKERSHRPSCSTTIGTTEPMITATSCNVQLVGCTHHSATRRLHMIRREIVLPAPREDVWEALTEPARLEDWVAKHLATLADAGLVESQREGRETRYRLTEAGAEWDDRLDALVRHLQRRSG